MAVVSHTSIENLIESGDIVVFPLNKAKIDVRLGNWFFFRSTSNQLPIYPYTDGFDPIDLQRIY